MFSSHNFSIHFFSLAGEHKEICSPAKTFLSILFDYFFFDWRTNKICVLRPKFCNSFISLVGDFFVILFYPENKKKCSPAESHFIYSFYSFFLFIFFWAGEQKKSCSPAKFVFEFCFSVGDKINTHNYYNFLVLRLEKM